MRSRLTPHTHRTAHKLTSPENAHVGRQCRQQKPFSCDLHPQPAPTGLRSVMKTLLRKAREHSRTKQQLESDETVSTGTQHTYTHTRALRSRVLNFCLSSSAFRSHKQPTTHTLMMSEEGGVCAFFGTSCGLCASEGVETFCIFTKFRPLINMPL